MIPCLLESQNTILFDVFQSDDTGSRAVRPRGEAAYAGNNDEVDESEW